MTTNRRKFNRYLQEARLPQQDVLQPPALDPPPLLPLAGAGVTGSFLARTYAQAAADVTNPGRHHQNTATERDLHPAGGRPSHTDTFDLKVLNGITPASFNPADHQRHSVAHGPDARNSAAQLPDFALIRSMQSHALVHSLAQTWTQIGRNPAAALGNIAPNIGSIVAIEKDPQRAARARYSPRSSALNSAGGVGNGYFSAPLRAVQGDPQPPAGIAYTTNPGRPDALQQPLEPDALARRHPARRIRPTGSRMDDYNDFYAAAQADDVQPGGQPGVQLHRRRQRALRHHQHRQRLPGGQPGAEGQPGHALHPDHFQRRLGHAPEHLRRRQASRQGQAAGRRGLGAC